MTGVVDGADAGAEDMHMLARKALFVVICALSALPALAQQTEEPGFEAGEAVQAEVDPEFRRYCRRAHTASHVLYGAGRR